MSHLKVTQKKLNIASSNFLYKYRNKLTQSTQETAKKKNLSPGERHYFSSTFNDSKFKISNHNLVDISSALPHHDSITM